MRRNLAYWEAKSSSSVAALPPYLEEKFGKFPTKEIQPSYESMQPAPNAKYAHPIEPQASLLSTHNRGVADAITIAKPPDRRKKEEPRSDVHKDTSMGIGLFLESRLLNATMDLCTTIGVNVKSYLQCNPAVDMRNNSW